MLIKNLRESISYNFTGLIPVVSENDWKVFKASFDSNSWGDLHSNKRRSISQVQYIFFVLLSFKPCVFVFFLRFMYDYRKGAKKFEQCSLLAVRHFYRIMNGVFSASTHQKTVAWLKSEANCNVQHWHVDNSDFFARFLRSDNYLDWSLGFFVGFEEKTALDIAKWQSLNIVDIKRNHIHPGNVLVISGNHLHRGIEYLGNKNKNNIRMGYFIDPFEYMTDSSSQLWFKDGEKPRSRPFFENCGSLEN